MFRYPGGDVDRHPAFGGHAGEGALSAANTIYRYWRDHKRRGLLRSASPSIPAQARALPMAPIPSFALPCNSTRERVSYPFIAPLRALPHRNFSGRVRKRRLFSETDRCALSRNDLLIRGERGAILEHTFPKTGKIIGKSYALRGNTVIIYLKKAIDDISSSS